MEQEMDEFFGRFSPGWPALQFGAEARAWAPSVDMIHRKEELLVRADLPGLEQKDVEVSVDLRAERGPAGRDRGRQGQ
jgi:HSP20 family protein